MKIIAKLLLLLPVIVLTGAATEVTYQYPQRPIFVIQSVECIRTTSGSDTDTVYISRQPEGARYPKGTFTMSAGEKANVGRYFYPKAPGSIALYEEDSLTADDEIGKFNFTTAEKSGTYVITMTGDGAEYRVTIQVRN